MLSQWICVFLLAATVAVNSAVITTNDESTSFLWNNTIIEGTKSIDNVLIHTEVISDYLFFYTPGYDVILISRFEVIDLDGINITPPTIFGGVGRDYLFVHSPSAPIGGRFLVNIYKTVKDREMFRGEQTNRSDRNTRKNDSPNFNITIYAEPRRQPINIVHGELTPKSVLIWLQNLHESDLYENTFVVSTNSWNVTQVRLTDNINGYGGSVEHVFVDPDSRLVSTRFEGNAMIDYRLEIYAEPENKQIDN